ncbi:hypothetical protein LQD11_11990 [Ectothiorhodospira shaposhnikovii]|nr:hypothetical protein [Ectothiorhodospira shaposhnikovii]MCG5513850.1 hypothetical protein [Ectothiorhodospira shaposhnikovii]
MRRPLVLALPLSQVDFKPTALGAGFQFPPEMSVTKEVNPASGTYRGGFPLIQVQCPMQDDSGKLMVVAMHPEFRVTCKVPFPRHDSTGQRNPVDAVKGIIQPQYEVDRRFFEPGEDHPMMASVTGFRFGVGFHVSLGGTLGCQFDQQSFSFGAIQIDVQTQGVRRFLDRRCLQYLEIDFRRGCAAWLHQGCRRCVAAIGNHLVELPDGRASFEKDIAGSGQKLRMTLPGTGAKATAVTGFVASTSGKP